MTARKPRPRPRGSGSISIRKSDNLVVGRLPRDPETGRREAVYGRSRDEVQAKLTAALAARQARYAPADRQLLRDYLARWLEETKRPRVAPSTYVTYASYAQHHILPALGHLPLARITPGALERFYAAEWRAGYRPGTLKLVHAILRGALASAVRRELLPRNPATLVENLPPLHRAEPPVLDEEPAKRLLAVCRDDRDGPLVIVALTTGLRRGELAGLRWSDIDWEAGLLRVEQKHVRVRGQVLESLPKGGKARVVDLSALAAQALRRQRRLQQEQRLAYGTAWARPDLVFTGTHGQPYSAGLLTNNVLPRLLTQAGLPRMTAHALRHAFASLMLKQGVPVEVVSRFLGHADASVTFRIYRHLLSGETHDAMQRLDRALEGSSGLSSGN